MNYHNITTADMMNGSGLRGVLWLSGCAHKCKGCQNPQTWDAKSGIPFDELAKEELFKELDKDYISGLTLTGGDPLFEDNLGSVLNLVNEIRLLFPQKTIWVYTGYTWEDILNEDYKFLEEHDVLRKAIVAQCDILVDGRYIDSQRDVTLPYRGSKNQRLIDIQKTLQKGEIVLWQT